MTSVHGMTNVYLAPECNEQDRTWVSLMLRAAEIEAEVVKTCSCGYATECGMHCNHELNDGKCIGPNYFKLNGIETRVKAKPQTPSLQNWQYDRTLDAMVVPESQMMVRHIDRLNGIVHLRGGETISLEMYRDMEEHGDLGRLTENLAARKRYVDRVMRDRYTGTSPRNGPAS
jgi:hypothetical protein